MHLWTTQWPNWLEVEKPCEQAIIRQLKEHQVIKIPPQHHWEDIGTIMANVQYGDYTSLSRRLDGIDSLQLYIYIYMYFPTLCRIV